MLPTMQRVLMLRSPNRAPARCWSKGQRILVVGAAGAVGQALVALGRLAGCEVWGVGRAKRSGLRLTACSRARVFTP